jgi:transposase
VAIAERAVVEDGTAAAGPAAASAGLSQSAGARPGGDAIFFVLRTGCQWNALNATGICSSSSAHRRFQEWTEAGVFETFWRDGLLAYDAVQGIDWSWLSLDGAMGKAPLGGEKNRSQPDGSRQAREQAQRADGWAWHAALRRRRWR